MEHDICHEVRRRVGADETRVWAQSAALVHRYVATYMPSVYSFYMKHIEDFRTKINDDQAKFYHERMILLDSFVNKKDLGTASEILIDTLIALYMEVYDGPGL